MIFPSGEYLTLSITSVCPSKLCNYLPSLVSQIFIVLSTEPETKNYPSKEKLILSTSQ